MNRLSPRLASLALVLGSALAGVAAPAVASSTAASSASEGGSASVGSVSDSFETSSESSSKNDKTAAGDYKVIDVAAAPDRPGTLRLELQPVADANEASALVLYVPERAVAQTPVAAGQVISARQRPYGVEFAQADTGKAFFLVMHDNWYRELHTKAVVL